MGNVRFEIDRTGVRALLQSGEMASILESHASAIAGRLPDGYEAESVMTATRAKVNIIAKTPKARADNSKNNTLLKALGGGA